MASYLTEQELMLERKTQHLMEQLRQTEHMAEKMRQESDRLRRLKDEAKAAIQKRHPYLFNTETGSVQTKSDLYPEFSTHQSTVAKELLEIRHMLKNRDDDSLEEKFETHIRNIRREAGVGSSGHEDDGGGVDELLDQGGLLSGDGDQLMLWPRDCIPVPRETFKRILAQANRSGRSIGPLFDEDLQRPDTVKSDDTSNDAADLSQELHPDPSPRQKRPSVTKIRVNGHSSDDDKEVSETASSLAKDIKASKNLLEALKSESPALVEVEPHPNSDDNFIVASDNHDEKLYSSKTSTSDESSLQRVNNPYRFEANNGWKVRFVNICLLR